MLLLFVVLPTCSIGAVWDCNRNKNRASALYWMELKRFLAVHLKPVTIEAVRGDMGLDTLSSRRDRAKLKWWHNLCTMKGDTCPYTCRYPRHQVWEVKPRRGRQRKMWGKRVDDIHVHVFEALLRSCWMVGNSSSESFLACVDECVSERESKAFWKGLDITKYGITKYGST